MSGTIATFDWLQAKAALEPKVAAVKLISPHQAREIAQLHDVDRERDLCDSVMQHLGFTRSRLGRIEFYLRAPEQRQIHHARPDAGGNRAARRARK